MHTNKAITVAVLNANDDVVDAIRLILSDAGYITIGAHVTEFKRGYKDFVSFIREHRPQIIVYDIAPPYEENWRFFKLIRENKEVKNCKFVLTTTNKSALEKLVGKTVTIEIIGKPFDLNEIVEAVNREMTETVETPILLS